MDHAAACIQRMHGEHRFPHLLKLLDTRKKEKSMGEGSVIPYDKELIDRIKRKLPEAARNGWECAVFGASSHHYKMNSVPAADHLESW